MNKQSITTFLISILLTLGVQAQETAVKTYKPGDKVAVFNAADQHGKAYTFQKGTRYLLVSFDMSTGKKANKALHAKGAEYLSGKKAVYVANIYGMPKIGRAFALPKMRRYAHTIILADAKGLLAPFPEQKGKVTVLTLDRRGVVKSVAYWDAKKDAIGSVLK